MSSVTLFPVFSVSCLILSEYALGVLFLTSSSSSGFHTIDCFLNLPYKIVHVSHNLSPCVQHPCSTTFCEPSDRWEHSSRLSCTSICPFHLLKAVHSNCFLQVLPNICQCLAKLTLCCGLLLVCTFDFLFNSLLVLDLPMRLATSWFTSRSFFLLMLSSFFCSPAAVASSFPCLSSSSHCTLSCSACQLRNAYRAVRMILQSSAFPWECANAPTIFVRSCLCTSLVLANLFHFLPILHHPLPPLGLLQRC